MQPLWPADEVPEQEGEDELEPSGISLLRLQEVMAGLGVDRLLGKTLSRNDNSKQQVYTGPNFEGLNLLPNSGLVEAPSRNSPGRIHYAPVTLAWVNGVGETAPAPATKLIYYPQYPEVRLSGFLQGARFRPSAVMTSRQEGRVLLLGVRDHDGAVFAYADTADSRLAAEVATAPDMGTIGVFRLLAPAPSAPVVDWRSELLRELRVLAKRGWVRGSRRTSATVTVPCNNQHCGGYTLESELNIVANSDPGPDYHGIWELKAHSGTYVTIMDKTPSAGFLATGGFLPFMARYGYPDAMGRANRRNFGGQYRVGDQTIRGLRCEVIGYDMFTRRVDLRSGRVALVDESGAEALAYPLIDLMNHWRTKHMKTAYVDYMSHVGDIREYKYGPSVTLCEGTDPLRVIDAIARGKVIMDHSPYVIEEHGVVTDTKRRFPIRVRLTDLDSLYDTAVREPIA